MTTERHRDPLERLRVLNPVPPGALDDLVRAESAQAWFREIVAGGAPGRAPSGVGGRVRPAPSYRRRRALRLAVPAGLASLFVAVAGYALVLRQPTRPHTVACFAAADLQAETAVVGVEGGGPVAACAGVWDRGYLGGTSTPPLRACLLDSGGVGVFPEAPARDVCLDLGLAPVAGGPGNPTRPSLPADDPAVATARFLAFRDAVLPRLVGHGCIGVGPAEAIVREELTRAGLEGWAVVPGVSGDGAGFSPDRPCASLDFKPETKTVELVPLPPPPTAE